MVVGVAQSMLKAKGLPDWFWGEAIRQWMAKLHLRCGMEGNQQCII
jgi:hypothetical protein